MQNVQRLRGSAKKVVLQLFALDSEGVWGKEG